MEIIAENSLNIVFAMCQSSFSLFALIKVYMATLKDKFDLLLEE